MNKRPAAKALNEKSEKKWPKEKPQTVLEKSKSAAKSGLAEGAHAPRTSGSKPKPEKTKNIKRETNE